MADNNISKDLFLSILAMDSYNRGYGAGISDGDGVTDEDGNDADGLGEAGEKVGSATVLNIPLPANAQSAGFYALAYDIGADGPEGLAGTTVISYRGTDDVSGLVSLFSSLDIRTGWPIGGGVLTVQARLAMEFYFSVKQANPEKTIVLTGQSLGGGLAGLVASLTGEEAFVVDNMPFELASDRVHEIATITDAEIEALAIAFDPSLSTGFDAEKQLLEAQRQEFIDTYYNGEEPQPIDRSKITGTFLDGEALEASRNLGGQTTVVEGMDAHSDSLGRVQLHDFALLDIIQFAKDNEFQAWQPIGTPLWDAIFSNDIGEAAGFELAGEGGRFDPRQKLVNAIAYSALDGSEGLVFGNTGIRALFDVSQYRTQPFGEYPERLAA